MKNCIYVDLCQVLPDGKLETHRLSDLRFDSMPLLRNVLSSFLPQVENFISNELPVSHMFTLRINLMFDNGNQSVSESDK